jgi:hypothetical protein
MLGAILELSGDSLEEMTQLDVLAVEALMLWPDDPVARNDALTTTTNEFANRHLPILPPDLLRSLFSTAHEAIPLKTIRQLAEGPFLHGCIAGIILAHTVNEVAINAKSEKASIGWIIKKLSKSIYPKWRLMPKTIENAVWPKFRSVSHFWAAYVTAAYSKSGSPFPCRVDTLTDFLAKADAYRAVGETTRTRRSPRILLMPGECVGIPPNLRLPKISFPFSN